MTALGAMLQAGNRVRLVLLLCAQVAALAPKTEAMEASWNRLRAISGADAPEQVIEYWQGRKRAGETLAKLMMSRIIHKPAPLGPAEPAQHLHACKLFNR